MEITNILGKFGSQEALPKPFLALVLTDELVQAAVWHVHDGVTEVVSLGTPIEWTPSPKSESLLQAVDATVSSAVEGLSQEPTGVVFGLPSAWTEASGITPAKLEYVKLICKELELKPLGYVLIIDSLLRYLKMQEGTPSTSLLIQIGLSEAVIYLVKLGRIQGQAVVGRSDDIAADVEEGISRLQVVDNLPSRVLVYDGMHNLEEIVQNLVSYDWQAKFKFLHLPKVENLPKDIVIRSVAIAGGAEVAKAIGFELTEEKPASPATVTPPPPPAMPVKGPVLTSAAELGFHSESAANPDSALSPKVSVPSTPSPKSAHKLPSLPKLPAFTLPQLPRLSLPKLAMGKSLWLFLGLGLLVITGLGLAYWFVPKAELTLGVAPKDLPETVILTLSTEVATVDTERGFVPAKLESTTVSGSSSAPATGTKTVGERAKGEVVIYNRTNLSKTFAKGTTLSANGLDFTLNDEVSVASASAGADYVQVPGKASVAITAADIGDASNLPENTEFSLEDYSKGTYVARNSSSLSGGSSRETTVASQKDLDSLVESLSASLADQARTKLAQGIGQNAGIYLLPDSLEIISEDFTAEAGDETETVEASLEVKVQGIAYSIPDVLRLVDSKIEQSIPEGYLRSGATPSVELSSAKEESETELTAEAKVVVPLIPNLKDSDLKRSLRGVPSSELESALGFIPGLQSIYLDLQPKLPGPLERLPRNPQNITIYLESV